MNRKLTLYSVLLMFTIFSFVISKVEAHEIVGEYENHLYDKGGKNDWHYVYITEKEKDTFVWKNKANVSWTLKATASPDIFEVQPDCPYYKDYEPRNHLEAKITRNDKGKIISISGPFDEPYMKINNYISSANKDSSH